MGERRARGRDREERLRLLLDAVVTMAADLTLDSVLQRIVAIAGELVDAQYAALGVLSEAPRPPAADVRPPRHARGPGRRDRPPAARARPAGTAHRPTRSRCGCTTSPSTPRPTASPTTTRRCRRSWGCRSASATGSSATSTSPRRPVAATSRPVTRRSSSRSRPTAGVAIENARLYDEASRRQRWLAATAEITALLTAGDPGADALQTIADRAREVAGADVAWIMAGQDRASLVLRATSGAQADPEAMRSLALDRSLAGVVVETGAPGGRRRHRLRPPSPRRLERVRLAEPRPRGGGAAAVRRAGRRRAGPGVEPGAGRGLLLPGPRTAGQLRRARRPWPCRSSGPARTASAWRRWRTATASDASCTTW